MNALVLPSLSIGESVLDELNSRAGAQVDALICQTSVKMLKPI